MEDDREWMCRACAQKSVDIEVTKAHKFFQLNKRIYTDLTALEVRSKYM
jgi:hypothetical protein